MRGTDEGDEHLNMKGAVCDLLSPQAVHLQRIDPITQKQAIQTGNKTSSPGSLLPGDIKHHALITGHYTVPTQCERATTQRTKHVTQHRIHSFVMLR